jgi:hypothetical protein
VPYLLQAAFFGGRDPGRYQVKLVARKTRKVKALLRKVT